MKNWSDDENQLVSYDDLLSPLKRIMHNGYRLERLPITHFMYSGYNIGSNEQLYFPTPEERFSSRWIENDAKFKRSLLDNVLITAFQLGMEQGRRLDRRNRISNKLLEDILKTRIKMVKNLKFKLSEYDNRYKENSPIPLESGDDDLIIENMQVSPDNVDV